MKIFDKGTVILTVAALCVLISASAYAGLSQIKAYKEIYPDAKLKCGDCHTAEHPKKEDGQHDLNDYGKAVVKAAGAEAPKADAYKMVGKVEDFKK